MAVIDPLDRIVCPPSGERLVPDKVWDMQDPKTKEHHRTGTFKKHHHWYKECDYSGMAGPIVRDAAPTETPPASTPATVIPASIFYDDQQALKTYITARDATELQDWWYRDPAATPEPLTFEQLSLLDGVIEAAPEDAWVDAYYAYLAKIGYTGPTD